uniref:Uncharacterized protein n=1 Tax=Anguilla anguilla TaxID=7936 RepID=A0A0E9RNF1_ANGAN
MNQLRLFQVLHEKCPASIPVYFFRIFRTLSTSSSSSTYINILPSVIYLSYDYISTFPQKSHLPDSCFLIVLLCAL